MRHPNPTGTFRAGILAMVVIAMGSAVIYAELVRRDTRTITPLEPPVPPKAQGPEPERFPASATFYGRRYHGRKTAGFWNPAIPRKYWRFNMHAMTCAHKTLPFGAIVRSSWNGRSVETMVTDRMPGAGRIDLSRAAFQKLAPTRAGVLSVVVEVTHQPKTVQ